MVLFAFDLFFVCFGGGVWGEAGTLFVLFCLVCCFVCLFDFVGGGFGGRQAPFVEGCCCFFCGGGHPFGVVVLASCFVFLGEGNTLFFRVVVKGKVAISWVLF